MKKSYSVYAHRAYCQAAESDASGDTKSRFPAGVVE